MKNIRLILLLVFVSQAASYAQIRIGSGLANISGISGANTTLTSANVSGTFSGTIASGTATLSAATISAATAGTLLVGDGSLSQPALVFTSATTTGLFKGTSGGLAIRGPVYSSGSSPTAYITSTGRTDFSINSNAATDLVMLNWAQNNANVWTMYTDGSQNLNMLRQGLGSLWSMSSAGTITLGNSAVTIPYTSKNVLINTTTDVASSKLTVSSTTQGVLMPQMTTAQRNAIASPAEGLEVYDLTAHSNYVYNGSAWTNNLNGSNLVNNVTTSTAGTPLDAAQGKTLKDLIDALTTVVSTKVASTSGASTFETLTTPTLASPTLTGTMSGAGAINTTGAITTTGNITRSGFQTTDSQLKVGLLEFQSHSSGNNWIGSNVYYNTNGFKYRTSTGGAVLFYFKSAEGQFRLAVAGTQDASLPNTGNNVQMKINVDGTFAVGAPVSDTEGLYTGATFKVDPTGNTTQTGKANYTAVNATAGVTGNVTNNSPSGLVRFAAAATTLTVTNSYATTSSKIFVQVTGTDATAKTATVTKAAGSFVITLNAAATAETAVDFFLIN